MEANFSYSEAGMSVEIVEIVAGRSSDDESPKPRDSLLQMLDNLQKEVEGVRNNAMRLEDQKDSVMTTLDTIRHSKVLQSLEAADKEEIESYLELVTQRCQTVHVKVQTPRDNSQEDSLHKVNTLIDSMVSCLRQDPHATRGRCLSYMHACSSSRDEDETLIAVATRLEPLRPDKGFEAALLGCTLDDQKHIKRRLQGLLQYINNL